MKKGKGKAFIGAALVVCAVIVVNIAQKSGSVAHFLDRFGGAERGNVTSGATAPADYAVPFYESCRFATDLSPERNTIVFGEIAWMGNAESPTNEWFSLAYIASDTLDISGYQVVNQNERIHIVVPRNTVVDNVRPLYVLARKSGIAGIAENLIFSGAIANTNEGLRLFDSRCRLLDEVFAQPSWPAGDNISKATMKRDFLTLEWFTASTPQTKPAPTVSSGSARVVISEVMAGIEGNTKYEFIELYNTSSESVDLTGWTIKKRSATGNETVLVSAARFKEKTVPSGGFLLLANGTGYTGNVAADVVWPSSYSLASKKNGVMLYNTEGKLVDGTMWEEIPEGKSIHRLSWEGAEFAISDPDPKNSVSR